MARRQLVKRTFADIDRGPLGGAVFEARKRLKVTQAQLAGSIARDRPWLSDVETGKVTHVPDEDLTRLAGSLEMDYEFLREARDSTNSRLRASLTLTPLRNSVTKTCAECGYQGDADARYCASCGGELPHVIRCSHCARVTLADANFCPGCGEPLR